MKHKPRPTIHMEKQLGWTRKLGGSESLGISKEGRTLLARLMESQMWHQIAGSVGGGFTNGTTASACLDARHFSFPVVTGSLSSCYPGAKAQRE